MTKQEVIEKAYGEFWGAVKKWVDENGWFEFDDAKFGLDLFFERGEYDEYTDGYNLEYRQRPKSLRGIENNFGWIKIETVDDLPKEDCHCWILDKERGIESGKWVTPPAEHLEKVQQFWLQKATHYQVMDKPESPKY